MPFLIRYIPATKEVSEKQVEVGQEPNINKRKEFILIMCTGLMIAFVVYGVFTSTLSKVVESHYTAQVSILTFSIAAVTISGVLQSFRMALDPFLAPLVGKLSDEKFGRVPVLLFALQLVMICLIIIPIHVPILLFVFIIIVFQLLTTACLFILFLYWYVYFHKIKIA